MPRRSTALSYPPAGPPADVETGVAGLRSAALKLFRREDGEPADWGLLVTCLFKLGFDLLDKLPADRRAKLAQRVHERAYSFLATDAGAERIHPLTDGKTAPAGHGPFRAPSPRPPR